MNKIVIALCAFLAVACAEQSPVDGYVQFGMGKLEQALYGYDQELTAFKNKYHRQVETIDLQRNLIVDSITRTNERFTPMEWINGPVKQCVLKYRGRVSSIDSTLNSLNQCRDTAYYQVDNSILAATAIRNNVVSFIEFFQKEIAKCGDNTARIYEVISETIKFLHENGNAFNEELEAARCAADVQVKKTTHCYYLVESEVQYRSGEVNALFNLCIVAKDECRPCGNTCEKSVVVDGNSQGKTIANPFFGSNKKPNCLLVNFEYNNSFKKY